MKGAGERQCGDRKRVLVVDDDAEFLAAVVGLIDAGGYEVRGVGSLQDLKAHLPLPGQSCVLVDVLLQGESGLDLPALLRDSGRIVPVVFMSATDDPAQIHAANEAGVVSCLRKPFEMTALFAALDSALAQSTHALMSSPSLTKPSKQDAFE